MTTSERPWVVLKFGGTSVSSLERWETIAAEAQARLSEGLRPLIVCSALSQVSNQLEAMISLAPAGEHGDLYDEVCQRHRDHAAALGVCYETHAAPILDELHRLLTGASLTREVSPRLHARIMASGELLATRLGAAWMARRGLSVAWHDARALLRAQREAGVRPERHFLAAQVSAEANPALQGILRDEGAELLLTQGFIASDHEGETVLLGRGGSDTSAAYFAAQLQAHRCEIWTDVPGMYTANPRDVPGAKLLRALSYAEAQEIASTGAKVLHPRCIAPLQRHAIPLHIRCTPQPELEGTIISREVASDHPQVKAVSSRSGLVLVSMETSGMWQQVGFLGEAFAIYKRLGLSVDAVSSSETNVSVTLDPAANALNPELLRQLEGELRAICNVEVIPSCASVSLVGHKIRSILPQIAPALEAFEEKRIHLVTQAANDLNLTFVVDTEEALRLVKRLHASLFETAGRDALFGPSWGETFQDHAEGASVETAGLWWMERADALVALASAQGPTYVYDEESLRQAAGEVLGLRAVERVFYSIKANAHEGVLRTLLDAGVGFECVSEGELRWVLSLFPDLPRDRILFTPNFAPRGEYAFALSCGVHVTVDNLHPLEHWGDLFAGKEILLRLDPGRGRGHHKHVRTAGAESKFGLSQDQVDRFRLLSERVGARVVGLHAHSGSGIHTPEVWREVALFLVRAADQFPDVRVLDIGGGLAVPERIGQPGLDLPAFDALLQTVREAHPRYALWVEPGRFLVAQAGALLARVTQVKHKGEVHYIGIETGMNSLIRPALYGAYHPIENLTKRHLAKTVQAHVVGPICESGDTLGHARMLPPTDEGDVLLIGTTGAYGHTMSSFYNRREAARETLLPSRTSQG